MNGLLNIDQVTDRLQVYKMTARRLQGAGAFPAIRLSERTVRYDEDDIAAYIARNKEFAPIEWPETFSARMAEATGERIKPNTQLLKPKVVQEWLGISATTLYRWAKSGRLPRVYLRPKRIRRFDAADVQALVESRRPDQIGARPEALT